MKRMSFSALVKHRVSSTPEDSPIAPSEQAESVADAASSTGSKPRLSLAGVMLSRRFAKRMSVRGGKYGRSSSAGLVQEREPTYRMEPVHRFNCVAVEKILKDVIERKLTGIQYDPKKCSLWIRTMSEDIKDRVKMHGFDRYKIVCVMVICQRHEQAATFCSRCQWDKKNDNFATYTYKNEHVICNATVYGLFRE